MSKVELSHPVYTWGATCVWMQMNGKGALAGRVEQALRKASWPQAEITGEDEHARIPVLLAPDDARMFEECLVRMRAEDA